MTAQPMAQPIAETNASQLLQRRDTSHNHLPISTAPKGPDAMSSKGATHMKAIICERYGTPDVLKIKEIEKPVPKDNEVLIRVHATTVTVVDSTFRQGKPMIARLFVGLRKPKHPIQGGDFAGEIEAVGKDVQQFQVGDQVFGAMDEGFGAHAEYICRPQTALAKKPANLNYEEAASVPYGALTALPFLRDEAQIKAGQKILINGASGGVGIMAVQLAKYYGAEVTGVCSSANMALVRSMGADKVIDYSQEDFTKGNETYDIIFDLSGKTTFSRCKHLLTPKGRYLTAVISASIMFQMFWTSKFSQKKAKIAFTGLRPPQQKVEDLAFLGQLLEAGQLKPVIDRVFPLAQAAEAHRYIDAGNKQGNTILRMMD